MLFSSSNSGSNGSKSVTVIGEDVKIDGKLHFKGSVKINGKVTGDIVSNDVITVGKFGDVESNIKTRDAVIAGNYKGDMVATGLIEIKSTGKFIGNITQKNGSSLMIEKGGIFKGKSVVQQSAT
jgi:cytoskeletal protein CcmA (bactofilin family)